MFLRITPTATTQIRAAWCHWCLTTHGPRMCKAMRMAMADPPIDPLPDQPGDPYPGVDYEEERSNA